jgi:hypothetical protein
MMYPPCPHWVGWYGPWTPLWMHFHLGWSRPAQGFGHGGYYAGDGSYGHIGHQQDRKASGQENQTVQNAKLDHLVSDEAGAVAPSHRQEQEAPKDGSSIHQQRGIQKKAEPESESSANSEAKPDVDRVPEVNAVVAE